jgi:hypothetical protein
MSVRACVHVRACVSGRERMRESGGSACVRCVCVCAGIVVCTSKTYAPALFELQQ